MRSLLQKGPGGQFIGSGKALSAWIGKLLDAAYADPLGSMLNGAASWCQGKAAKQYRFAADWLTGAEAAEEIARSNSAHYVKQADLWMRRREVLIETAKKLSEVK